MPQTQSSSVVHSCSSYRCLWHFANTCWLNTMSQWGRDHGIWFDTEARHQADKAELRQRHAALSQRICLKAYITAMKDSTKHWLSVNGLQTVLPHFAVWRHWMSCLQNNCTSSWQRVEMCLCVYICDDDVMWWWVAWFCRCLLLCGSVAEENVQKNINQMSKSLKQVETDVKNAQKDKTAEPNDKFVDVMTISLLLMSICFVWRGKMGFIGHKIVLVTFYILYVA